jgi:tRNA pseudouridine55 synthase
MDGILNINKPQGLTSFDVVKKVKYITGERHTGHAGTLDPCATGVLPVCLGKATRIIEYLFDDTKSYRADIEFGTVTDTYDCDGRVVRTSDAVNVNLQIIEAALDRFRGDILQTPPMYSAIKHRGQPLYKYARQGVEIKREKRPARISAIEIVDWQPPVVTLDITCGKGTYIRSLAFDLGESVGCGAYMKSLVRLRVGRFEINNAVTLTRLESSSKQRSFIDVLYPVDYPLDSFPSVQVDSAQVNDLLHGSNISISRLPESENRLQRAYTPEGLFIGMIKYLPDEEVWKPHKIFLRK